MTTIQLRLNSGLKGGYRGKQRICDRAIPNGPCGKVINKKDPHFTVSWDCRYFCFDCGISVSKFCYADLRVFTSKPPYTKSVTKEDIFKHLNMV